MRDVFLDQTDNLLSLRRVNKKGNLKDFAVRRVKGKSVLDVGICEHDLEHQESSEWLHKKIIKSASYVLGIDIIESLIKSLENKGYNVFNCDATSDVFLGEKFDVVHIGDVIEHVNDPVKLLKFSKRHLNENGEVLVVTPNPWFVGHLFKLLKTGVFSANNEHVSWVTPSMALEIARRSGLVLDSYYVSLPATVWKKFLLFWLPLEFKGAVYFYIFKKKSLRRD